MARSSATHQTEVYGTVKKAMIANFVEFRALFSVKFQAHFVALSLWRHAKWLERNFEWANEI